MFRKTQVTCVYGHVISFKPLTSQLMKMDALSAAYDSDTSSGAEEEETPQQEDEATPINVEESSSVLSRLKEKFPLNSAPAVPIRVSILRALIGNRDVLFLRRKIRTTCCD